MSNPTPKNAHGAIPTGAPSIGSPVYSVPTSNSTGARIFFTNTNTDGTVRTVSVWIVPTGAGSILASHLVISAAPVVPGLPPDVSGEPLILIAGDRVYWQASGAGLNGFISALEEVLS